MTIFDRKKSARKEPARLSNAHLTHEEKYNRVRAMYDSNGFYDTIVRAAYDDGTWVEALKSLRTVAHRSVEFYVSKVLPNPQVVTDNEAVKESIERFQKWSNFKANKPADLRAFAMDGDLFLKVVGDSEHVYRERIKPEHVTSFKVNPRGFLVEIRIDVPSRDDNDRAIMHTEYWTESGGYFSIWRHRLDRNTPLDRLGEPVDFGFLAELGIDFIPIVYCQFLDTGDKRGAGCIDHTLDKIDEANREATRLTQMLFRYNKPLFAIGSNMIDSEGRPIPAPKLATAAAETLADDNQVIHLPGMASFETMVPQINYADALAILQDMMHELEQDLPELKYYSLAGDLSGKAVSQLLAGAIDRAREARENLSQAYTRLNEMALTLGVFWGLFPATLGNYRAGDFEHTITADEMFSDDMADRATALSALVAATMPLVVAMKHTGFTDDEIADVQKALTPPPVVVE